MTKQSEATASPARERPVRADEVTRRDPQPALGVGVSMNRRGEEQSKSLPAQWLGDAKKIARAARDLYRRR